MSIQVKLLVVLVVGVLLLTIGASQQQASVVMALPLNQSNAPGGGTIPYPGHLTDEAGRPVADGVYAFTFALYEAETGGKLLWTETQANVTVLGGSFTALLGSMSPLPKEAADSSKLWLQVAVRGPGESELTPLSPRQVLSVSSTAPASTTAGPACAHDHFGESWDGTGLTGLGVTNGGLIALHGQSTGSAGYGVYGEALDTSGAALTVGVAGDASSNAGYGGYFTNDNGGIALYAEGNGSESFKAALRAKNTNTTNGIAAYFSNSSNYPTAEFDQTGNGKVLDLQTFGAGDFIAGFAGDGSTKFRIASNGDFYADGTWNNPAADFAEMLPAVEGLEPGDVLVIGPDGKLIRSAEAYQASVAGVYSTQPGFIGGQPMEGKRTGTIPLAMIGIVPVKISTENGPVQPGDLLVSSSTPGYAMRAGSNPPQGTVIGKALEKWDAGAGVIKMLATLQ